MNAPRAALAALAAVLAVGMSAPAPGAGSQLKRSTAVTASRSAAVEVSLAKPVTVSTQPFDNPHVAIGGSGRVVGMLLRSLSGTYVRSIALMRLKRGPMCVAATDQLTAADPEAFPRCPPADPILATNFGFDEDPSGNVVLPAGPYLIFVVTDGSPVRVDLTLKGLSGSTTIAASERITTKIVEPLATNQTGPGPASAKGSGSGPTGYAGDAWGAVWLTGVATNPMVWGVCAWHGAPLVKLDEPLATSPACTPAGAVGTVGVGVRPETSTRGWWFGSNLNAALWGRVELGAHITAGGSPERVGIALVWIDY